MPIPTAALLAVSAGLKIAGVVSDHVAQEQNAEATRRAAQRALRLKRNDLTIRGIQEGQKSAQSRILGDRQATDAIGAARAAAAAAGVEGRSADAILGNIQGDLGRFYQSIDSNLTVTLEQLQRYRLGAEAEAQNQINSAPRPSLTATALRLGGVGIDALTQWNDLQPDSRADMPTPGDLKDYERVPIPFGGRRGQS